MHKISHANNGQDTFYVDYDDSDKLSDSLNLNSLQMTKIISILSKNKWRNLTITFHKTCQLQCKCKVPENKIILKIEHYTESLCCL